VRPGIRFTQQSHFTYEIYTTSVEIERTFNNGCQLLTHTENSTAATFTYDANGNRLSQSVGGAVTNYTWDTENRLRRIQASGLDQTTTYVGAAPCAAQCDILYKS